MGPEDALIAAEWIGARKTVPMHYNTFPLIEQDADLLSAVCQKNSSPVKWSDRENPLNFEKYDRDNKL